MNGAVHNVPDEPVEPEGLPADEADFFIFRAEILFKTGARCFGRSGFAWPAGSFFSEWRERVSWQGDAEVLCVDHGLRPESAAEAEFVAGAAAEHGLSCRILRWTGEKPASNIQDEARRARYRLFADHMAQSGAEALVLAHHMDDQAETFLDRLTRGSGLSGLSAMAADEPHGPQGLRLLRPFLNLRKERLEASLRERGLSWCLDPSNQDPKYKRSRLRKNHLPPGRGRADARADRPNGGPPAASPRSAGGDGQGPRRAARRRTCGRPAPDEPRGLCRDC
ncbi:tRNA lysidine(34) synthetase TilS [Roseibium salinum]|nr:tRNA lysidine(34) synthetase TilS [Roseibium salinum]